MRAGRLGRIARLEASPRVAETVARSWGRRRNDDRARDKCGRKKPKRRRIGRSDRPPGEFHSPVDGGDDGPDDEDRRDADPDRRQYGMDRAARVVISSDPLEEIKQGAACQRTVTATVVKAAAARSRPGTTRR